MPKPADLFLEAEQLREQAASTERYGHDVQRQVDAQDGVIRGLEQRREELQRRQRELEMKLSASVTEAERNARDSEIQDIQRRMQDLESQIQTAYKEKERILA